MGPKRPYIGPYGALLGPYQGPTLGPIFPLLAVPFWALFSFCAPYFPFLFLFLINPLFINPLFVNPP